MGWRFFLEPSELSVGYFKADLDFLVLSGLATGCSWLCYFRALQLGDASKVAPVDKLSVVFVIVFAALFLGEMPTIRTAIGAVLIVVGAIVLCLPSIG